MPYNNYSLAVRVNDMLPTITSKRLTYSESKGAFLSDCWTSAAGNTYGQLLYLSPHIAIVCDFGVGYAHTFLNGLKVLRYNGHRAEVIDSRYYQSCFYSDSFVRREAAELVKNFIESQMRLSGRCESSLAIEELSNQLISEAVNFAHNQLNP